MIPRWVVSSMCGMALLGFVLPVQAEVPYPLKTTLRLDGHGGCTFKVPDWTVSGPKKDNLAVLKTNKVKGSEGYFILMLTVEHVPAGTVDWNKVRQNVQAAAKKGGAELLLTLGAVWTKTPGFTGRQMLGVLTTKGKRMVVQLISMAQAGRLVTVTLLTAKETKVSQKLLQAIASAVKR